MRIGLCSLAGLAMILMSAACSSSPSSSGVFEVGKGTYTIVVQGRSVYTSLGELKKIAYEEAIEFCWDTGMKMQPVSTSARPGAPYVLPTFELVFRPVSAAEYREPGPEISTTVAPGVTD